MEKFDYIANLKLYWKEHLVHIGVGGLAGYLLMSGYVEVGFGVLVGCWVRQGLEFLKRDDTPGVDLGYIHGGKVAAIVAMLTLFS